MCKLPMTNVSSHSIFTLISNQLPEALHLPDIIEKSIVLTLSINIRPGEIPKIFENSPLKPLNDQPN